MSGYWAHNEYVRLSVSKFIEGFCGWDAILELVNLALRERDRAFLATLFETGGRVSQVLASRKENFDIQEQEGVVIVQGMTLLKRYKKLKDETTPDGKKRWVTEKVVTERSRFPIPLKELLVPIMLEWVEQTPEGSLLFPSPYKRGAPIDRSHARGEAGPPQDFLQGQRHSPGTPGRIQPEGQVQGQGSEARGTAALDRGRGSEGEGHDSDAGQRGL